MRHHRVLRRRNNRAIHHPATAFERHAHARLAVPTEGGSSGHLFFSAQLGHTGFTGTSILDRPRRELFRSCCFANRVHPTREKSKKWGRCDPPSTTP